MANGALNAANRRGFVLDRPAKCYMKTLVLGRVVGGPICVVGLDN